MVHQVDAIEESASLVCQRMANCQVWQKPAALAPREAILELEVGRMGRMRIGLVTGVIDSAGAHFDAAVTDLGFPP